jgi:penicillin-binding protein 2
MDMAIGQQDNKFTALQLANYVAMIANDGRVMQPYLVQKIISPDGKVVQQFSPNMVREVNVSPETMEVIREGMHMVTLPPSGTAAGVFAGAPYQVAAKTGTAEVGDPTGNTNALFVAFAPFDEPKIAVSVVLGYGGKGSGISGPVARQIIDEFFKVQK